MRIIIGHIVFFVLLSAGISNAQTGKVFSARSGHSYFLQFTDSIGVEIYQPKSKPTIGHGSVFCTSSGVPLFINTFYNISTLSNATPIEGSDSIVPPIGDNSIFLYRNDSVVDLLTNSRSHYFKETYYYNSSYGSYYNYHDGYLFDDLKNYPSGIYQSAISLGLDFEVLERNNHLYTNFGDLSKLDVRRFSNFKYRLCHNSESGLMIGLYENGGLSIEDSIPMISAGECFDKSAIPLPPSYLIEGEARFTETELSHRSDKLIMYHYAEMGAEYNGIKRTDLFSRHGIYTVDIDRLTGKAIGEPRELIGTQNFQGITGVLPRPKGVYTRWRHLKFSPDDSIVYFVEENYILDSVNNKRIDKWKYKIRYIDFRNSDEGVLADLIVFPESNRGSFPSIEINPYGKLIVMYDKRLIDGEASLYNTVIQTLLNTNDPNSTDSEFAILTLDGIPYNEGVYLHLYDYLRFKSEISYACDAQVSFTNRSDLSLGIKHFEWHFTKSDGTVEISTALEPEVTYLKSGDYPFKVRGYSGNTETDYSEWYFDTMHIKIPDKPVANFVAIDTTICAYKSIEFINLSSSDTINPNEKEKWIWTFGDVESFTTSEKKSVEHVYKTPGVYNVSLYYSNGYCDSMLLKSRYINVSEAPQPGFEVDNQSGCAPFTVTFKDTIQQYVSHKEYFYSDENTWREEGQESFDHTFKDPGIYFVVQRLHGYYGCITQLDTLWFSVAEGVSELDSTHIDFTTYSQDGIFYQGQLQDIHVEWSEVSGAVLYEIFRNGQLIGQIDQAGVLSYADSLYGNPSEFVYTIAGIDSCGTRTRIGTEGKPILLSGKIVGSNQSSILTFTSYRGKISKPKYTLYRVQDHDLVPIADNKSDVPFEDQNFLDTENVEKCYVVKAVLENGEESYSNLLCLTYLPMIHLPSAISANDDGLNDVFSPIAVGVASYELEVYNRWGQQVYHGTNSGWMPEENSMGVYMYVLRLQTTEGQWLYRNGTVTVLQ